MCYLGQGCNRSGNQAQDMKQSSLKHPKWGCHSNATDNVKFISLLYKDASIFFFHKPRRSVVYLHFNNNIY